MPERSMIDEVRRLYPEASSPTATDREHARDDLAAEIATGADGRGRLPSSRRTGPRWLVSGAVLTAAAATLLLVFVGGPEGTVSNSSAAEVLRQAAAAELDTAPPLPGPGQYLYVKSEDAYMSSYMKSLGAPAPAPGKPLGSVDPLQPVEPEIAYSMLVPHIREVWMGSENSLLETHSSPPEFLSESDRRAWEAHGSPEIKGGLSVDHLGPTKPLDLPSDPNELYDQFHAKAARVAGDPYTPDGDAPIDPAQTIAYEMFRMAGESLRERSATPEQRAALFEVASRLDGIELVGDVTDTAGRPGIAIAMLDPRNGIRDTFVFDPDTSALLAEEEVVAADDNEFGYPVGTVIGHSTYLERAIVDKSGERP